MKPRVPPSLTSMKAFPGRVAPSAPAPVSNAVLSFNLVFNTAGRAIITGTYQH
jgi:hypothetical protein